MHELLAADDVDLVLNLTIPEAHAEVAAAALESGKHVYGENRFALNLAQARAVLARVDSLRVGCTPDTVLGTGTQTARKALADGLIRTPTAANATFTSPGHESWHPDPEFYYRPGGGPLFDMGPYYFTALVHLLGPVERVVPAAGRSRATRTIGSRARVGGEFGLEDVRATRPGAPGPRRRRGGTPPGGVTTPGPHAIAPPRALGCGSWRSPGSGRDHAPQGALLRTSLPEPPFPPQSRQRVRHFGVAVILRYTRGRCSPFWVTIADLSA
jgi:predicted dehydrogenase